MKTFIPVILVLTLCVQSCKPGVEIPPTSHPDLTDWQDLFTDDLSNAIFPKGVWTFEKGILTASKDHAIWTEYDYDNFMLDLEFKTDTGTNSGVILYCTDIDNWAPNSIEIQIADDYAERWANSPSSWQCGAVFGHLPATKSMVEHPGEWNRFTITCVDHLIYVLLNGEQIIEMDMKLWTEPEVNPDGSEIPSWLYKPVAELPTHGHIGFHGKHAGAPIYFRNLKIKELNSAEDLIIIHGVGKVKIVGSPPSFALHFVSSFGRAKQSAVGPPERTVRYGRADCRLKIGDLKIYNMEIKGIKKPPSTIEAV